MIGDLGKMQQDRAECGDFGISPEGVRVGSVSGRMRADDYGSNLMRKLRIVPAVIDEVPVIGMVGLHQVQAKDLLIVGRGLLV